MTRSEINKELSKHYSIQDLVWIDEPFYGYEDWSIEDMVLIWLIDNQEDLTNDK